MTNSSFSIRSRKVARRFLQSAVIVDDKPHFGEKPPQKLVTPSRGPSRSGMVSAPLKNEPVAARHDLDARRLINAFAELGVVCAVLKTNLGKIGTRGDDPGDTIESLSTRTDEATKRADIVILDWNIPEEDHPGQNAKRLIREILKTDDPASEATRTDDHSRRLRLVAIYTGDEHLDLIAEDLGSLLGDLRLGEVDRRKYRVSAGPVTIVVYGKDRPTILVEDEGRRVGEDDLPERLQSDFTDMTNGLLSNAALEALSTIRINTHRILSRFDRGVDAPYVAHRAMMQPPDEAAEHPIPLIASEIEGVLADDNRISELVGLEAIEEWLDSKNLGDGPLQHQWKMDSGTFKLALLSLLERGVSKAEGGSSAWKAFLKRLDKNDRKAASLLTQALSPEEDGAVLDMRFALLASLRSQYSAPPPVLKLGTIVKEVEGERVSYWLCVQPVCDSVRIDGARQFPFLRLRESPIDSDGPFDFVVLDQQVYRRLRCSRKAFEMSLLSMESGDTRSVKARQEGNDWLFQVTGDKPPLRWVADLKTDYAHRVIDEFANEIRRVGLTESEWLRRMARKS